MLSLCEELKGFGSLLPAASYHPIPTCRFVGLGECFELVVAAYLRWEQMFKAGAILHNAYEHGCK